jgi:microsomal dipeptidase-like Zn-dependent dipeptidase
MEELNMIVDLAHSSPKLMNDVLNITTRPVIVSHTGVKGVVNNNRNLSDQQIKKIAEKQGVIGIGYWQRAIGGNDAKAIVKSIRYVAELVGVEHVALGSDFDGSIRAPFDSTGVPEITEELLNQGFSHDDISLIMGGNVVKLLMKTLPK